MNGKAQGFALLAVVATLALAGCGGGGGSAYGGENTGGGESTASNGGSYGTKGGGAYASGSTQSGGGTATVSVGTASGAGSVIVDSEGLTLYYFEKDGKGSGRSACAGACAEAWPPLLTAGAPKAEGGAESALLGTIEREDGTSQVTYAGWPLYAYVGDKQPGEDNGTDSNAFGAPWYPVHPNGRKAGE